MTLDEAFKKYNCDKSTNHHNYVLEYEKHLKPLRRRKINILEVGIFNGTSMSAFHDYLPNAKIYGVDIFVRVPPENIEVLSRDRVQWLKANSMESGLTNTIKEEFGDIRYDVIIDDGLHTPEANLKTFLNFFPLLKDDGVYYIEDVWPLDIMTNKEMQHRWVQRNTKDYNMLKYTPFLNEVEKYKVERIDLRKTSGLPDSYIFKVTK